MLHVRGQGLADSNPQPPHHYSRVGFPGTQVAGSPTRGRVFETSGEKLSNINVWRASCLFNCSLLRVASVES